MISLIDFKDDLIIPKEEAIDLGIKYKTDQRIGFQDDKLQKLNGSYDYYKEDCFLSDDGKYYKDKEHSLADEGEISAYYLYLKYTGDTDYVYVNKENHLVSLIEFAPKCKHAFFVRESVVSMDTSINNIEMIFHRLEEKASQLEQVVDKIRTNTFNKRTDVHVGGGIVTSYNDLLLKEDVCTDVLQQELNNGWRIIAICVQPDQRRPDYILGRYNPQLEVAEKESAGR